MKMIQGLIAGALLNLAAMTGVMAADGNALSVHVLNLQDGLPSTGLNVELDRLVDGQWQNINKGVTDDQGRISALYPSDKAIEQGNYRVVFKTGEWFSARKAATFFPEVPVIFRVDGSLPHYHIPLLLSPYGYSTYRGN